MSAPARAQEERFPEIPEIPPLRARLPQAALLFRKYHLSARQRAPDAVALGELAVQHFEAQGIQEVLLDRALERAGTIHGIVALVGDELEGFVVEPGHIMSPQSAQRTRLRRT